MEYWRHVLNKKDVVNIGNDFIQNCVKHDNY